MDYLFYRILHFSKLISLGIYPKNTASILLAVTTLFNLMSLFKLFDFVYLKRGDAVFEILLLLGLVIFFRVYYSVKWEYLQEKYINETRRDKAVGFIAVFIYLVITFVAIVSI